MFTVSEYSCYKEDEIVSLYTAVGWTNYTRDTQMLKNAFEHSLLVLGAYDCGKLIGIIRAVGDGASIVYIQDILVLPEYQRKGVGRLLMKGVMERFPHVYQMCLMTDDVPETVSFYEAMGFKKAEKTGCCGFMKIGL